MPINENFLEKPGKLADYYPSGAGKVRRQNLAIYHEKPVFGKDHQNTVLWSELVAGIQVKTSRAHPLAPVILGYSVRMDRSFAPTRNPLDRIKWLNKILPMGSYPKECPSREEFTARIQALDRITEHHQDSNDPVYRDLDWLLTAKMETSSKGDSEIITMSVVQDEPLEDLGFILETILPRAIEMFNAVSDRPIDGQRLEELEKVKQLALNFYIMDQRFRGWKTRI